MANSAPKDAPVVGGPASPERGGNPLTAEDAERFAEAFVPSWQFDEAPFTAGVMSQDEMERLAAASSPMPMPVAPIVHPEAPRSFAPAAPAAIDELTVSDVDVSGFLDGRRVAAPAPQASAPAPSPAPAPPPQAPQMLGAKPISVAPPAPPPDVLAPLAPMATTRLGHGSPGQDSGPPSSGAMPIRAGKSTLMMAGGPPLQAPPAPPSTRPPAPPPSQRPKPPVPVSRQQGQGSSAKAGPKGSASRNRPAGRPVAAAVPVKPDEDTARLLLRKPNRGPLVLGAAGVLAVLAIVVGVRAMSHGDETPPVGLTGTGVTAAPVAPPPPAHTDDIPPPPPPAEPTPAAETATPPPAAAAPVRAAPVQAAPPAPKPPPPTVTPAQLPRATAPAPRPVAAAPAPRPAATPKTTTKSGGGGIVRDNPF